MNVVSQNSDHVNMPRNILEELLRVSVPIQKKTVHQKAPALLIYTAMSAETGNTQSKVLTLDAM